MSIYMSGMGMNPKMNKSYSRIADYELYIHDVFWRKLSGTFDCLMSDIQAEVQAWWEQGDTREDSTRTAAKPSVKDR